MINKFKFILKVLFNCPEKGDMKIPFLTAMCNYGDIQKPNYKIIDYFDL